MKTALRSRSVIDDLTRRIHAVESAPHTSNIMELFGIAEFDLDRDLRFANWSGASFHGYDLAGCDFTGARLSDCDFTGARIVGARFDQAEVLREQLRASADWYPYLDSWQRALRVPNDDSHLRDLAVFSDAPWAPEMIVIPSGHFQMGSTVDETRAFDLDDEFAAWEQPKHEVEIAKSFALGRYAVTFEEFDFFCRKTGKGAPNDGGFGRGRRPVINVNWSEATAYCEWLSSVTGAQYRLPCESEWEYACRAATDTAYHFGDALSPSHANYLSGTREKPLSKPIAVDHLEQAMNSFGLHQMHGNIWEWCRDPFVPGYLSPRHQWPSESHPAPHSDTIPPESPETGEYVIRGGSWFDPPRLMRSAKRMACRVDGTEPIIGFRIARDLTYPDSSTTA